MLQCLGVGALHLAEQVGGGGGRGGARPHRDGIDQQAHHRVRPGHVHRASRDRRAEHDVTLAGLPHQYLRPRGLQHRAHRGLTRARQIPQRPRGLLGHRKRGRTPSAQPQPARRPHQRRNLEPGQHLTPDPARGIHVTAGQPGHKRSVGTCRGQPLAVVAGEDLPQQDRQRPTVQHDVVVGQHEQVAILVGPDQCGAKGRLVGQRAHRGALVGVYPLDLRVLRAGIRGTTAQIDVSPGHLGVGGNDLNRVVELVREPGHQVRMADDHRLHRLMEATLVEPACQRDVQLHRVHIVVAGVAAGVAALRGAGMKQQPLLQGSQWENISYPHKAAEARRSAPG